MEFMHASGKSETLLSLLPFLPNHKLHKLADREHLFWRYNCEIRSQNGTFKKGDFKIIDWSGKR